MDRFIYLPEFRVVVCKRCRYAILPSKINTHFAGKPHQLDVAERRRIVDEVSKVPDLITSEEDLQGEFPFPAPSQRPVEGLAMPKRDGLQCTIEVDGCVCGYICTKIDGIRRHCTEEHGWKSTRRGGRPKKGGKREDGIAWRTNVSCQRFFVYGPKSRDF